MIYLGIDKNNTPIIGGVFENYDTYGIPISESLRMIKDEGYIFSLEDFIGAALSKKIPWDDTKIAKELSISYSDAYIGNPTYEEVLKMVKMIILKYWDGKLEMNDLGLLILSKTRINVG